MAPPLKIGLTTIVGLCLQYGSILASESGDTVPAAAGTSSPPASAIDLIQDHPTNELLRDGPGALTTPPDQRHDLHQTLLHPGSPLKEQEAVTDDTQKAQKFAAATVLAAMRRLRRHYYTNPFEAIMGSGDWVSIPHSRGIDPDTAKHLDSQDYLTQPIDETALVWNWDGVGDTGDNLNVMPPSWSEIAAHHYIQSPHTRHGCWTIFLRSFGSCPTDYFEEGKDLPSTRWRAAVADICSGKRELRPKYFASCPEAKVALTVVPHHMSTYNLLWVDTDAREFIAVPEEIRTAMGLSPGFTPSDIKNLKSVKWSEEQRAKGYINVWDYIMLQRLHAWDFTQQQAVLNEYFADHKRIVTHDATAEIDLDDPTDCNRWRKSRPGDPADGTQCRPDKTAHFQSNGR